jgi:hypothetical protein
MYHWELILDYLDPLILVKLATVCKLFSIRANENKLKCQDEIDKVSNGLLYSKYEAFESTFQCSTYKNKIHIVTLSNKSINVKHYIY